MSILLFPLFFFFVFLIWGLKKWSLFAPWAFVLWMGLLLGCGLYAPSSLTWTTFLGFNIGFLVFCQDLKTRYFSRLWLLVALFVLGQGFFLSVSNLERLLGFGISLLSFRLVQRQSLGLADAIGLCVLGLSLGLYGLCAVVTIASLACLVYDFFTHERLLPFLSFLAWAYCLVYWSMVR